MSEAVAMLTPLSVHPIARSSMPRTAQECLRAVAGQGRGQVR